MAPYCLGRSEPKLRGMFIQRSSFSGRTRTENATLRHPVTCAGDTPHRTSAIIEFTLLQGDRKMPKADATQGQNDYDVSAANLRDLADKLIQLLRIRTLPIGMKLFEDAAEMMKLPGIRTPTREFHSPPVNSSPRPAVPASPLASSTPTSDPTATAAA